MTNQKIKKYSQQKHRMLLNAYSDKLEPLTREDCKNITGIEPPEQLIKAYMSKEFLVQLYQEKNKPLRITINKTTVTSTGNWEDNITWDEIQKIKNEIGFENKDCVEIYPAEKNIVNVANMRHIWVMEDLLDFSWKNKD